MRIITLFVPCHLLQQQLLLGQFPTLKNSRILNFNTKYNPEPNLQPNLQPEPQPYAFINIELEAIFTYDGAPNARTKW